MKQCTKCKVVKDESDFYRERKNSETLRTWCKTCWNQYNLESDAKPRDLTEKENDILVLLAEGEPRKMVAVKTNMSESTLDWYLTRLFSRYNKANIVEMVAFVVAKGLIIVEKHNADEESKG